MTVATNDLTCRELIDVLADYFGGDLGPRARSLFDRHVMQCPECVAYLRSYAETMRLAKDAHEVDRIPADVPDELVKAILEARKRLAR